MNHIRIIDKRKTHRLGGLVNPGKSHTLCGGEMTDRDISWKEAKKDMSWLKCPDCRKILIKSRRKADEKV